MQVPDRDSQPFHTGADSQGESEKSKRVVEQPNSLEEGVYLSPLSPTASVPGELAEGGGGFGGARLVRPDWSGDPASQERMLRQAGRARRGRAAPRRDYHRIDPHRGLEVVSGLRYMAAVRALAAEFGCHEAKGKEFLRDARRAGMLVGEMTAGETHLRISEAGRREIEMDSRGHGAAAILDWRKRFRLRRRATND